MLDHVYQQFWYRYRHDQCLPIFLSRHLNTNFGNTKIFIVSWSLLLFAVSRLTLTSGGGTDQVKARVIRFSFGGRLGFRLGRCPSRSYARWAPVSLALQYRIHHAHASLYPRPLLPRPFT